MPKPPQNAADIVRDWFDQPLGAALLDAEAELAARLLERVFGFVAVSIGDWWPEERFLSACAIRRQLRLNPASGELRSALDNLALASDSIDAILLPHTLEFVESPQRLLREVDRVLVGEGHVLILGFNPWSGWTARRALRSRRFPEAGNPLTSRRLVDWLHLLGFEIEAVQTVFRRPPISHAPTLERLAALERPRWLPLPGAAYAVLARKHVYAMTRLRPQRERRRRITAGVASPVVHATGHPVAGMLDASLHQ